jgi:hypothetical protein
MPEDEPSQVFEFVNAEVGSKTSLLAFSANDANTNIGLEDHPDVVASISYRASSFASISANLLSDQCFLSWTASTHTNTRCFSCHHKEVLLKNLLAQNNIQSSAIDH